MRSTCAFALVLAAALCRGGQAGAAEKEALPGLVGPVDWLATDRAAWMQASLDYEAAELKEWYTAHHAKNTFIKACVAHLKSPKPEEFDKISQRQACYDLCSYLIEYDAVVPTAVRPVRFFHATTTVTSRLWLGYIETSLAESEVPVVGVQKQTRDLVKGINKALFALNSRVLRDLIYTWKEPRSPLAGATSARISPLRFDLDMVQLEQGTVQGILAKPTTSADAVIDLNGKLKSDTMASLAGMGTWRAWAREAGAGEPDFRSEAWRRAFGSAIVFSLHRLSKEQYLAFMKDGTLP